MLTVTCMKWGGHFASRHVNVLFRALQRSISEPFRMVCLTDDLAGLAKGIQALPIPPMELPAEYWADGCWPKLSVFMPGLFGDAELVLYLDLDIVILQPIDALIERARSVPGLHILREWNPALINLLPLVLRPDRGPQSSIFAWRPQDQHQIYQRFLASPDEAFRTMGSDQTFIGAHAWNRHYWPIDWTVSFRRGCVWSFPLNMMFRRIRRPATAKVVVFHGLPRPWDLVCDDGIRWGTRRKFGFGPVDWVADYWSELADDAVSDKAPHTMALTVHPAGAVDAFCEGAHS